jgi:hypothetical protein
MARGKRPCPPYSLLRKIIDLQYVLAAWRHGKPPQFALSDAGKSGTNTRPRKIMRVDS